MHIEKCIRHFLFFNLFCVTPLLFIICCWMGVYSCLMGTARQGDFSTRLSFVLPWIDSAHNELLSEPDWRCAVFKRKGENKENSPDSEYMYIVLLCDDIFLHYFEWMCIMLYILNFFVDNKQNLCLFTLINNVLFWTTYHIRSCFGGITNNKFCKLPRYSKLFWDQQEWLFLLTDII